MDGARNKLYLAAVLIAGMLVRLDLAGRTAAIPLVGDEADYVRLGHVLAEHHFDFSYYPGSFRMPGYPCFLALLIRAFGPNMALVKMGQAVVSMAVPVFLYLWVRDAYGTRVALAAAAMGSLLPELVGMAHLLWSETLFTALMAPALWLEGRYFRKGSLRSLPAAGALWGLAVLVKSNYFTYVGLAALLVLATGWKARSFARGAAAAALYLLPFALLMTPWLARNHALYGRFPYLSSNSWINMWAGNKDPQTAVHARYHAIADELAREELARHESLSWIARQGWRWLPLKVHRNVPKLWGAENYNIRHMWLGAYGPIDPGRARLLVALALATYVPLILLACAGLAAAPRDSLLLQAGALVLPTLALHVVMVASTRYRIPLLVPVLVYAARALAEGARPALRRPAFLALAAAFAYCLAFAPDNYIVRDLWHGRGIPRASGPAPIVDASGP